jgi:hypothetical protein
MFGWLMDLKMSGVDNFGVALARSMYRGAPLGWPTLSLAFDGNISA